MKKLIIVICILLIISTTAANAQENYDEILEAQEQIVNIEKFTDVINKLISPDSNKIIPQFSVKQLIRDIAMGNVSFNIKEIFERVLKFFFKEVYLNLEIIIKVIILVLLCALLQNLKSSFGNDGVGEIAFYSCYIFIAAILIKHFLDVLNLGKAVINNLVIFMQAFIPTLFTLLITTGNITASTVLQPSIIFSIEIISTLIKNLILPLILFYTVLAIVNNISDKVQVSKLADLIKNVGTWLIVIFLTIFISILSLQSKITSIADGVGTKAAKFAVSTFVPIVGKVLSDAVETVVGYSILIKNSISVVGMIVIILICLVPVIKIFALIVIYKLTAALIQPISDERIVKCISQMANSLTFISAAVISVSVMFLISVSIIINTTNTAIMMR